MMPAKLLALLTFFALQDNPLFGSPPQYTLAIYSNGLHITQKTLGHAFMVIKVRTNHGMKEEAFGFYSDPEANITGVSSLGKELPRLIIGTGGALHGEFDRNPGRFAKIEESLEIPITWKQRKDIYEVVREWDHHSYTLADENCINFVGKVATSVGIPVPVSYTGPNQFILSLKNNYRQEQARREAEAQGHRQAQRDAEAEAKRIPPGWGPCSCPNVHGPYGKFVNGILYHPNNLRCPK